MKLEYKILWIEDEPDTVTAKKRIIKRYIENEKGFTLAIKEVSSYEEFEADIGFPSLKEYDLLLVDLDLGEDDEGQQSKDGNKIVSRIRDEDIYTEIIFYSSQYDALKSKIQEHFVEGIFTSDRGNLVTKAQSIIDVTLRKVQDVNNLRGLIMAEVAELDRLKKNIIKKYSSTSLDNSFKKYIKEDVFEQLKSNVNSYDYLIKDDESYKKMDLESLVDELIYDSAKKARTVYKIKRSVESCSAVDYNFEDYKKCIVNKRNVLAHEEEKIRDDGTIYLNYTNGDSLDFTEEHCIQIRKDIKKYKGILKEIESKINE